MMRRAKPTGGASAESPGREVEVFELEEFPASTTLDALEGRPDPCAEWPNCAYHAGLNCEKCRGRKI